MKHWSLQSSQNQDVSVSVLANQELLDGVKDIYRENKKILGFLPDGAFIERFQKKQILIIQVSQQLAGYLLFSTTQRDEIRIAHLAIRGEYRGLGLSKYLVDALQQKYHNFTRIRLNCRADFAAANIWPRLNFFEYGRTTGKKADGSVLIKFQLALNDMPLFSHLEDTKSLPLIVCDTNVCLDILLESRLRHEAACGLLEDWIADEVELAIAEELFTDIRRINEHIPPNCESMIRELSWKQITATNCQLAETLTKIQNILGPPRDDSARSDQLHLATAAFHHAVAFATYDQELLDNSDDLLSVIGLRVQRPSEIITEIDTVVRSHIYRSRELRNSGLERIRMRSASELDQDLFVKASLGEKKKELDAYIDNALSNPSRFTIHQILNKSGSPVGLIGIQQTNKFLWSIDLLRVSNKLLGTTAGNTLAQYICDQPLGSWSDPDQRILRISNSDLRPEMTTPLQDRGFLLHNDHWWKLSLPGFWDYEELINLLGTFHDAHGLPTAIIDKLSKLAHDADLEDEGTSAQELEQLIHPGKLRFGNLPTYVIPIQPRWARELFDFRIWDRPLITPETNLVINPDSVYYKRPKNSPTTQFGRILWYVSGSSTQGGFAIRACSKLTQGVTGTIKTLFRRFESLGVFEWQQLLDHFGEADASGFAVHFTNTELLPSPITFNDTNDILETCGMKRQQFNSSIQITPQAFEHIYQKGMGV